MLVLTHYGFIPRHSFPVGQVGVDKMAGSDRLLATLTGATPMKSKKRLALRLKRFLAKSKAIDKRLARLAIALAH